MVRESYAKGTAVPWIQVHRVPDYVYFNHSIHVNRGISCVECHGNINHMDVVTHMKPFSMGFCLECHRDPASHVREPGNVFQSRLPDDRRRFEESRRAGNSCTTGTSAPRKAAPAVIDETQI